MAYPFVKALSWGEFREKLVGDHGVEVCAVPNPQGEDHAFLRRGELQHKFAILFEEDELLSPSALRCICHSLEIAVEDFGYDLG